MQSDGEACGISFPWRIIDDYLFRMDRPLSASVRRTGTWPHLTVPRCNGGRHQEEVRKRGGKVVSGEGSHSPKPVLCWGCTQFPLLARSGLGLCLIHWSRAWKPSRWACPRPERRKINLAGKREPPRAQCTLHNPIH